MTPPNPWTLKQILSLILCIISLGALLLYFGPSLSRDNPLTLAAKALEQDVKCAPLSRPRS